MYISLGVSLHPTFNTNQSCPHHVSVSPQPKSSLAYEKRCFRQFGGHLGCHACARISWFSWSAECHSCVGLLKLACFPAFHGVGRFGWLKSRLWRRGAGNKPLQKKGLWGWLVFFSYGFTVRLLNFCVPVYTTFSRNTGFWGGKGRQPARFFDSTQGDLPVSFLGCHLGGAPRELYDYQPSSSGILLT